VPPLHSPIVPERNGHSATNLIKKKKVLIHFQSALVIESYQHVDFVALRLHVSALVIESYHHVDFVALRLSALAIESYQHVDFVALRLSALVIESYQHVDFVSLGFDCKNKKKTWLLVHPGSR
jgi:hypothetical protein